MGISADAEAATGDVNGQNEFELRRSFVVQSGLGVAFQSFCCFFNLGAADSQTPCCAAAPPPPLATARPTAITQANHNSSGVTSKFMHWGRERERHIRFVCRPLNLARAFARQTLCRRPSSKVLSSSTRRRTHTHKTSNEIGRCGVHVASRRQGWSQKALKPDDARARDTRAEFHKTAGAAELKQTSPPWGIQRGRQRGKVKECAAHKRAAPTLESVTKKT